MLQFEILSGRQAGLLWEARRFPARVGRAADCELCLEDDGVWTEHFTLTSEPKSGFTLTAHSGALVMINQAPVQSAQLRNGDIVTVGAAKLAFRLSVTRQRSLQLREWAVWGLVAGLTAGQVAFIAWLLQ